MSPTSARNSGANPKKVEEMSYEAAFTELETIVAALEDESRPLDETLNLYERGQALASHCASLLEKAELKVRQLGVDSPADAEGQA
jgi:exodeoxyribonuclease VII small subunit